MSGPGKRITCKTATCKRRPVSPQAAYCEVCLYREAMGSEATFRQTEAANRERERSHPPKAVS